MSALLRKHLTVLAFCCVALALVAVAVGGCSNSTTPGPTATSTPASVTEALPAVGQPLVFPNHAGFSGQLVVPPNDAPAATNVTVKVFTTPLPAGPGTSDLARRPLAIPAVLPSGTIGIWEGQLDFSQAVNLANAPQVTMTLPSTYPTANYFFTLELWVTTGNPVFTWSNPSVSGQTLTFQQGTGPLAGDFDTYYFYLYASPLTASPSPSPSPSVQPSPSPSVHPSPSPSPSPSVSPSTSPSPASSPCNPLFTTCTVSVNTSALPFPNVPPAQWTCGGNPYQLNFNASEANYTGLFTAVSTNTQAATVTPSSLSQFQVTDVWQYPGGQAGPNFQVLVSDNQGNTTELFGDFNAICLP